MKLTAEQAISIIKDNQNIPQWVKNARDLALTNRALVYGDNFADILVNKIEYLESDQKAKARKKYAKDIRDLFKRVLSKRVNVFDASGGSEHINIDNEKIKIDFISYSSDFKSNRSIDKYLADYYFSLVDVDPNGLILLEYGTNENDEIDLEPCYKSIQDIRNYDDDGQMCEWVLFEPEINQKLNTKIWRIIDDMTNWVIKDIAGALIIDEKATFTHPFGQVPALILSDIEKVGSKERLSSISNIIELAKDYARDKSILTIYKFQNGFPVHYRFGSQCKTCQGTGKTGASQCKDCDGKGHPKRSDVTDMTILPIPKEGQPALTTLGGFMQPDLQTWTQYKTDLKDFEATIYDTIWGTDTMRKQANPVTQKTATEAYIDVQPINSVLYKYSDTLEYIHNKLANWIINFVDPIKPRDEILYFMTYGRRYILESPDIILDKYQQSKTAGDNNTILDKLLEEFIFSKYKNDPILRDAMMKKAMVEPYVHLDILTVFNIFGVDEAQKKVLFQKFWESADKDKTIEQLTIEFKIYYESSKIVPPVI